MTDLDPKALLPCPFCGGEASPSAFDVKCLSCGGEMWGGTDRAIAAWNRRAPGDVGVDRIAECIWQAEWKRAGNGGLRKVPWSEIADEDQERYRFLAREVLALTAPAAVAVEPVASEDALKLIREAKDQLVIAYKGGSYKSKINMAMHRLTAAERVLSASPPPSPSSKAEDAPVGSEAVECPGLDTPERVCFYEQDFYVLSNFSSFKVSWGPYTFPTSEHLYHWRRFFLAGHAAADKIAGQIFHAGSAHDAFKIAQANKHLQIPRWDEIKVAEMRRILRDKAAGHEYVRRKLLATGDRELVENSWRDDFWGWGPNRDGKNMLGKLWMEIRTELRALERGEG